MAAYSGFFEILFNFRNRPILHTKQQANHQNDPESDDEEIYEGVTIIRPIKGIDPELISCLESSFCQNYPRSKLQILFCVDDPNDPSIPIIQKLIAKYPTVDAQILTSESYNSQTKTSDDHYGPNPKVNNLAKGFVHAKYDILWVMDSNVWASSNILKNSVISLNGNLNMSRKMGQSRPVKLVHHVPLALSINNTARSDDFIGGQDLEITAMTPVPSSESLNSQLVKRKLSPKSNNSLNVHPGFTYSKFSKKLGLNLMKCFYTPPIPNFMCC